MLRWSKGAPGIADATKLNVKLWGHTLDSPHSITLCSNIGPGKPAMATMHVLGLPGATWRGHPSLGWQHVGLWQLLT